MNRPAMYRLPEGARLTRPLVRRQAPTIETPSADATTRRAPFALSRESECHVTPAHAAEIMARELDDLNGGTGVILEPSAGTGSLIRALSKRFEPCRVFAIEREAALIELLHDTGAGWVTRGDFLTATVPVISGIIMNPPFRQARKHIARAVEIADRDRAPIVALLPVTLDLPGGYLVEQLPPGTFATAPSVRTHIVAREAKH